MLRRLVSTAAVLLVIGGGCSDDDEQTVAPRTDEIRPETTITTADLTDCSQRSSGSSQGVFDPSGGTYAAQRLAVEGTDQLRFDVVQWLGGEDADEASFRETGDDSGAPNDYFIVNESE